MRALNPLLLCGLVLAFVGCASHGDEPTGQPATGATIHALRGNVQYSIGGGPMLALQSGAQLPEGATIQTGPDSIVDLSVNGRTSDVRLMPQSKMSLIKMRVSASGSSETMLNIDNGIILGSVNKINTNSSYEVETPLGVTGISSNGTDFVIQVTQQPNGNYTVTFTCVNGHMLVVANMSFSEAVEQRPMELTSGQSFTPRGLAPDNPAVLASPEILELFANNRPGTPVPSAVGLASDAGGPVPLGGAIVRAVHGVAQYSVAGQPMQPLQPGTRPPEGTTITTGPDSRVDLQINGHTSAVRIMQNSTMSLERMKDLGSGNSETVLNVELGTVLGNVKKITKDSNYEVKTPRGVVVIRGTDWEVQVTKKPNSESTVTFTCVTGQLFVVADINIAGIATQVPRTLADGESWTPPESATRWADVFNVPEFGPGIQVQDKPNDPPTPPTMPFYVPPVVTPATIGGHSSHP